MEKLRFTKYGRDGLESEVIVYGDRMEGFKLEQALKVGWHYQDGDKREHVNVSRA